MRRPVKHALILFFFCVPGLGHAECQYWNVTDLFRETADTAKTYAAFLGEITDRHLVSERVTQSSDGIVDFDRVYVATFSGLKGHRDGFTENVTGKVRIESHEPQGISLPVGPPSTDRETLFFFELAGQDWGLTTSGCGGLWMITENKPEIIAEAVYCLSKDGDCWRPSF